MLCLDPLTERERGWVSGRINMFEGEGADMEASYTNFPFLSHMQKLWEIFIYDMSVLR